MMRIRKKFVLCSCLVIISLLLFLYILLSYSVPGADKQRNLRNIENKLKQLENGLYSHREEMGHIKEQIDIINDKTNHIARERTEPKKQNVFDSGNEIFNQNNIPGAALAEDCPAVQFTNSADIQMLKLYKEIPFDNPDGGVWKQGWQYDYDPLDFNKHHKLKVFVVPHSHNDPGWIKTFDEYYEHDTKQILYNMLRHLSENPDMTFIWAEISYFAKWYETLSQNSTDIIKGLVKKHQLEFVTGGWVMPDEANSHWLSILMQLSEGQEWLRTNLNVTPKSSWAIDPFGHSATMPFLLKNSGFDNLLIQRVHYSVKKRLAKQRELEFRWRQIWDETGKTELFTHMMPFYSYDVPHTCGPDPKVCCQFDFKRLPGFGVTCPWRIPPQSIDNNNVAKRAEMIVDQWKKKSVLYKTRSLLIPLGDDFRYSQSTEWEAQRKNYEKLFDYINNDIDMHVIAKFGTLQEYFDSVRNDKALTEFPSLSGDFFTYADRDDHYWSGYYTSRPYHKRKDRVLLHYIRAAEMVFALSKWGEAEEIEMMLTSARRALSLFQHHDGITGTARTHVVVDYANQMNDAIKSCKFVIQQAAYKLLTDSSIFVPDMKFTYFYVDDSNWPGSDDSRTTIILGDELPIKFVVFHNSLPYWREELVEFYISTPYVKVMGFNKIKITSQISPVWSWHKSSLSATAPQASTTKYKLLFKARIPPLGLSTYIIQVTTPNDTDGASFAKIVIHTTVPFSINLRDYPRQVEFGKHKETVLKTDEGFSVSFNMNGLLKSIALSKNSPHVPVHLEFLKYGVRKNNGVSGAYLFLPDGPAVPCIIGSPTVLLSQGVLESSISTGLPFVVHETVIRDNSIEIRNLMDIGNMDDTEIIMRLTTNINSGDIFYTDLNGLQVTKRQRFTKIPLQANYYPIPSLIYIEDENLRITMLSGQPLGGSSLKAGQIEIMQDRRLERDDDRGLGQGVQDNQPVLHKFRLVLENRGGCKKRPKDYPGGALTMHSHSELQTLLYPVHSLIWNENTWVGATGSFGEENAQLSNVFEIGVLRKLKLDYNLPNQQNDLLGIVLHRPYVEECIADEYTQGIVNLKRLLSLSSDTKVYNTNLTLLSKGILVTNEEIQFCPMDVKPFIIQR